MTDIEKKALEQAVAAAGRRMQDYAIMAEENVLRQSIVAHARAIEQHEAFRQEVNNAVVEYFDPEPWNCERAKRTFSRFIIPKPDPLVEALEATGDDEAEERAWRLRAALAARGLEVRKIGEKAGE